MMAATPLPRPSPAVVPNNMADLQRELHEATVRFSQARQKLEAELAAPVENEAERAGAAGDELRAAHRDLEEITRRIGEALKIGPPS